MRFPKLEPLIEYLDSLTGRADLVILERLLDDVDITRDDLGAAVQFGPTVYRRNTIRHTEWYELLAICWRSGQRSPIHDHPQSSCAFRVIEGICTETRFERTPSGLISPTDTTRCEPGYICAAQDADIHMVSNIEPPGTDLITLHIYSPPLHRMNRYHLETRDVGVYYELGEPLIHGAGI